MNFWISLWKWVFVVGVSLFAGMSVWVTIGGFADIRRLFKKLDEDHHKTDKKSD